MPKYICHHASKFFEWSTIVDAPVTQAMTREEFEAYYGEQYGGQGLADLPERLDRAVRNGTSSMQPMSLESLVQGNRAGPDKTELKFREIIEQVTG